MSNSKFIPINFKKLKGKGEGGIIVIRLMMACNDIVRANWALSKIKEEPDALKNDRTRCAGLYFIRLQISHLNEAFKILEEIGKNDYLKQIILKCDATTKMNFKDLLDKEKGFIGKYLGGTRSEVTFHYLDSDKGKKKISEAVADRSDNDETRFSTITRASSCHKWHFKAADDVLDSVLLRKIWKIPKERNALQEQEHIQTEIHDLMLKFLDFSGEFIWTFCKDL